MPPIHEKIYNLPIPAQDRATFKGAEIARQITSIARRNVKFSGADYDIEVVKTRAIPNGVEIFARAWNPDGTQIGFGPDGTIDVERFVFINPPILVSDPNGDIVREWNDINTGLPKQRKLREDPTQAILNSLSHTISLKKEK